MKVCMVGLGSIGRKHLSNLNRVLAARKQKMVVDALRHRNDTLANSLPKEIAELIRQEYDTSEELPNDYDIVFVTNPTANHFRTIQEMSHRTKAMFIEKPLFEKPSYKIEDLRLNPNGIYYIACPLRYKAIMQYIKRVVEQGERIYAVRATSSSYLPEWRKGTDYRTVYSAKKELGGGVTLDLIHEWDYLTYLFGMPQKVHHIKGKYSNLEINSDDISIYIANYSDKTIEVHLDYIGRKAERRLELFCEDYKIEVNLLENTVEYIGADSKKLCFEADDCYQKEIENFLNILEGKSVNTNSMEQAKSVLELVMKEVERR